MDKIEELLTRGVEKIYPSKEKLEKVLKNKKITLYQGFDPTGDKLHIGHMIGLRKLAQFQREGHHVIFLIGTGTGQAGDPSGKTTAKEKFLSEQVLRKNATGYVMQAKKILNFEGENKVVIKYNSDWFNEMTLPTFLTIIGQFSLQQLIERDLFQNRIKKGESINLRAFIYPILQGWDSVKLFDDSNVRLEVGGSDQTFNMLMGRDMVHYRHPTEEKYVLTTPLLEDANGVKIGKSEGNVMALTDKPSELFGKILGLPDDIIINALEYLTDIPMDQIRNIQKRIAKGDNPFQYKKLLAFEIVKELNDEKAAREAQATFEKGEINLPLISMTHSYISNATVSQLTVASGVTESIAQSKTITDQGGLRFNDKIITDPSAPAINHVKNNRIVIQRGPRKKQPIEVVKG